MNYEPNDICVLRISGILKRSKFGAEENARPSYRADGDVDVRADQAGREGSAREWQYNVRVMNAPLLPEHKTKIVATIVQPRNHPRRWRG